MTVERVAVAVGAGSGCIEGAMRSTFMARRWRERLRNGSMEGRRRATGGGPAPWAAPYRVGVEDQHQVGRPGARCEATGGLIEMSRRDRGQRELRELNAE